MSIKHRIFISGLLVSVISTPAFANGAVEGLAVSYPGALYDPLVTIGGFYQNHNQSFGELDVLYPLWQQVNQIVFADVRGRGQQNSVWEGNFGGGYRGINGDFLWGIYGFYDINRSEEGNRFNQVTVGGELKTAVWSLVANGYFPVGKTQFHNANDDAIRLVPGNNRFGFENIAEFRNEELALTGGDLEVGYRPAQIPALTAYAGGYYFARNDASTIAGPRVRVTYDVTSTNEKLPSLLLESGVQHDNPRGTQVYAGIRVQFGGAKPEADALQRRMTEYIRRDFNIVTEVNTQEELFLNKNGTPITVGIATNVPTLENAVNNGADVVAVRGTINNVPTLQLHNDVTLTGGRFLLPNGVDFRVSKGGALVALPNSDLVIVGKNDTIRDISLTVTGNSGFNAIRNNFDDVALTGSSVGRLLIDNTKMNGGGVTIKVRDGSRDSKVILTNNEIEMGDITGTLARDAVHLEVGPNPITTVPSRMDATIAHNVIEFGNFSGALNPNLNGIANIALGGSTLSFSGGINGNVIRFGNFDNLSFINAGIFNNVDGASTMSFNGGLNNNKLSFGNVIGNSEIFAGILNQVNNASTLSFNGGMNFNQLTFGNLGNLATAGEVALGIGNLITNNSTLSFNGGMNFNWLTYGNLDLGSVIGGIFNSSDNSTISFNGGMNFNQITFGNLHLANVQAAIFNASDNNSSVSFDGGMNQNRIRYGNMNTAFTDAIFNIAVNNSTLSFNGGMNADIVSFLNLTNNSVANGIHNEADNGSTMTFGTALFNNGFNNNALNFGTIDGTSLASGFQTVAVQSTITYDGFHDDALNFVSGFIVNNAYTFNGNAATITVNVADGGLVFHNANFVNGGHAFLPTVTGAVITFNPGP